MSLIDHDAGLMNGLSSLTAEDLGLQSSLQELLKSEAEHVVESSFFLLENAQTYHAIDQGFTFKESLGIVLRQDQQLTGRLSNLGQ